VALGPAEIHPEEHLRPVRGFGAARAGADRQDRTVLVVLTREQQERPLTSELLGEGRDVTIQLSLEIRVRRLRQQLGELLRRGRALLETAPRRELVSEALRLLQELLGGALVVPEAGLGCGRVEVGDAPSLRLEVKDAPRSTGSARRGP
jgi:hypothetical protein